MVGGEGDSNPFTNCFWPKHFKQSICALSNLEISTFIECPIQVKNRTFKRLVGAMKISKITQNFEIN